MIIEEALRESSLPLYLLCGGSLTEAASALLVEPRIASRLTVVWIGGQEYRQLMVSLDELELRLQPLGSLGNRLFSELMAVVREIRGLGLEIGETFCLGDSALVLLTSTQSGFNAEAASSRYLTLPAVSRRGPSGQGGEALVRPLTD